ncbi:MAG: 3-keto-disaccharide hydrolase [Planctomycetota bacterium]|jgi:hypothetical protein
MTARFTTSMFASALVAGLSLTAVVTAHDALEPNKLTAAEKAAGWTLLFDGTSIDQWRGYRKDGFPERGWEVDDHAIHVKSGGGGGDIITRDMYGDFELSIDFRVAERANSGIIFRVAEKHGAPWQTGPEFQILDDFGHGFGPDDIHSTGAVYDLFTPDKSKVLRPAGQYNTARLRIEDGRVEHWLNDRLIARYRIDDEEWRSRIAGSKFNPYEGFGVQPRGHLCLQDHGDDVWFRSIKIRDLDAPLPGEVTLFNGTNLEGWGGHFNGGGSIEDAWSVEDGVLRCQGRPIGYIKTDGHYDNYVLQLEWRFDPEKGAGNSGVLLRMTGEDTVWPKSVEAQLHSGNAGDFWNIGKFRMTADPKRTNGRRTKRAKNDVEFALGEWNRYEIIVDRGDIGLFVNGHGVNRATNVEELAGPICLQSEGAEIHFRHIRLAPIQ